MRSNKNAPRKESRAGPEAGRADSPALLLLFREDPRSEELLPARDRTRLEELRESLRNGNTAPWDALLCAPLPPVPDPARAEEQAETWRAEASACLHAALRSSGDSSPDTPLLRLEALQSDLAELTARMDALVAETASFLQALPSLQQTLLQAEADLCLLHLARPQEASAVRVRANELQAASARLTDAARRFSALSERQTAFAAPLAPLLGFLDASTAAPLDRLRLPDAPKRLLRSRRAASRPSVSSPSCLAGSEADYRALLTRALSAWESVNPITKE